MIVSQEKIKEFIKEQHAIDGMVSIHDFELWLEEQPKVDEWIPCSERLPENIKTVLVTLKEVKEPTIGWYGNIDGWRLSEKTFSEIEHEVIAWMPLPEPYKEGE